MFRVLYQCSYRPVWYEAGEYAEMAAAVAAAARLHQARAGRPVRVESPAGAVVFQMP